MKLEKQISKNSLGAQIRLDFKKSGRQHISLNGLFIEKARNLQRLADTFNKKGRTLSFKYVGLTIHSSD